MQDFRTLLVIVGTFLPLIGTVLTVLFASITEGVFRWTILAVVPILTLVICWSIIGMVWKDGNMLAAALYLVYVVALFIYYPILTVTGLIICQNSRSSSKPGSDR
jgi:hypothetical protein